jgi:hypothetical protein
VADFVTFATRTGGRKVAAVATADVCRRVEKLAEVYPVDGFSKSGFLARCDGRPVSAVVLFLGGGLSPKEQALFDAVAGVAGQRGARRVIIVSTFRVHFGDRRAAEAEADALRRFKHLAGRTTVLRPSPVRSPNSRAGAWLRALWFCYPLLPGRLKSCCIEGDELFAAIEQELDRPRPRRGAAYTLLGPNRPWRELLRESGPRGLVRRGLAVVAALLSLLLVGHVAAVLFNTLARWGRRLRRWNFDTLYPETARELLALYNPYNYRHVKIVGYNNGVVHFGHQYPGRTVVSTVRCNHVARVKGETATFDAGVTVRQAVEVLGRVGKELHVLPNYSYVSLGTAFFIPIHGSASEYSTLGDTIERVLLYDPAEDRFFAGRRDSPAFRDNVYNLGRPLLLLRLRLRVKEKSSYYMQLSRLEGPTGQEVMAVFHDSQASNIEIRKAKAADRAVDVRKYYTSPPHPQPLSHGGERGEAGLPSPPRGRGVGGEGEVVADALPFPKDKLGRLWDRLEENPVSSFLFHWVVRRFIYHVELFIPPEEFPVFWETHGALPVSKIQLRYIRRDGLPHSPFQGHDCISADLSMRKKYKPAFDAYLKEKFRAVQLNPGKHSM